MFAKKTLLAVTVGTLLAAAAPAFAQHWGDGYRFGNRGFVQAPSAAGLTFEHWAAITPSPYGMSWGAKLADDSSSNHEFGEGERARLQEAHALYEAAGGTGITVEQQRPFGRRYSR